MMVCMLINSVSTTLHVPMVQIAYMYRTCMGLRNRNAPPPLRGLSYCAGFLSRTCMRVFAYILDRAYVIYSSSIILQQYQ